MVDVLKGECGLSNHFIEAWEISWNEAVNRFIEAWENSWKMKFSSILSKLWKFLGMELSNHFIEGWEIYWNSAVNRLSKPGKFLGMELSNRFVEEWEISWNEDVMRRPSVEARPSLVNNAGKERLVSCVGTPCVP